jgi:competence protein ComGF
MNLFEILLLVLLVLVVIAISAVVFAILYKLKIQRDRDAVLSH